MAKKASAESSAGMSGGIRLLPLTFIMMEWEVKFKPPLSLKASSISHPAAPVSASLNVAPIWKSYGLLPTLTIFTKYPVFGSNLVFEGAVKSFTAPSFSLDGVLSVATNSPRLLVSPLSNL